MAIVRGRKNHRTKIVLAGLTASAVMTATRPALLARVYAAGNSFEWEKQEDVNRLGGQYTSAARSADGSALMLSVLHGGEEGDQQESPLYISTDSGAAWENVANEADPGVQNQWTSVDVSNNGQVMAATSEWGNNFVGFSGENGKIVLSVDSGDTWDDVTPAGVTDWQSVVVSGDGTKIAAINDDEYDRVYVSENSGASWTTVSVPDVWHIKSVSISDDGDTMLVGGENVHDYDTQLYRTENNGADWSDISPNPEDGVYDVKHDLSSDGTKIVAAANSYDGEQAAKVFISDNSGDTWAEETTGDVSTSQWVDAAMSDDGTVVSVLNQDEVRISTDSGATWHAEDPGQTYEDTNTWQSIDFNSDGTDAIVAGLENAYITTGASPDPSTPSVNLVNPENSKAIQITTPDGTTITCHSAVKESGLAAHAGLHRSFQ